MRLSIDFPDGFSEDDARLAVRVGVQAVEASKAALASAPDPSSRSEIEGALERAVGAGDARLRVENQLLREQLARVDGQAEAVRRADAEAATAAAARLRQLQDDVAYERGTVLALREASGAAAEAHAREARDLRAVADEVRLEAERLRQELSNTKISVLKGQLGEADLMDVLEESGRLHVCRVGGNDAHHGSYHDLLAAPTPLVAAPGAKPPRYDAEDGAPRLSVEWKGHAHSSKMSSELAKFVERRALMVRAGLADCFLFVGTASVPSIGERWRVQVQRLEDRFVATVVLASPDISREEIALAARLLLSVQARLQLVKQALPFECEALETLRVAGDELLGAQRETLAAADELIATAERMVSQAKALRRAALRALLLNFAALVDTKLLPPRAEDEDLAQALASLQGERRGNTCRVIRWQQEFQALQSSIKRRRAGDEE